MLDGWLHSCKAIAIAIASRKDIMVMVRKRGARRSELLHLLLLEANLRLVGD